MTKNHPGARLSRSNDLREDVGEIGSNLRSAAAHAMPAAREQLARLGENVLHGAQSMEERLAGGIRAYPVYSVLIAAGVGTVIGLFLFRR